jgi:stage V sporulation protein B
MAPSESQAAAQDGVQARLDRGVLWNLASLLILGVSGFVMLGLIERLYGSDTLGRFQIVWGLYVVLSQVGVGGLDRSVLRSVSQVRGDPRQVAAQAYGALLPGLVLAAAVALCLVLFRALYADWQQSPAIAEACLYAAPGLFCFSLNKILLGVVNGLERMRAFAIYQSLRYLTMPLGVLLCWQLELPGQQVTLLFSLSEGLLLLVLGVEFLATVGLPRALPWRLSPGHLRFGARGVLAGVILELNTRLDVVMLGFFLASDGPVGIYSLAVAVAEGVFQVLTVLQNNYNPLLAQGLIGDRSQLTPLIQRGRRQGFLLLSALGLVAALGYPLGADLLMGDPSYRQGWLPFALLMGATAGAAAWLPFGQILLMGNRPGLHSLYMLSVLLVNGLVNWLLIPPLGLVGAALGTGASLLWSAQALRWLARRSLGVRL